MTDYEDQLALAKKIMEKNKKVLNRLAQENMELPKKKYDELFQQLSASKAEILEEFDKVEGDSELTEALWNEVVRRYYHLLLLMKE